MSNVIIDCTTGTPTGDDIQLTWVDCSNITRCHVVRKKRFASIMENGLGFGRVTFAFSLTGKTPLIVPCGNVTFRPDPKQRFPLLWNRGFELCFGKFYEDDGSPFAYCPRSFLYEQDKKLKASGINIGVGFELEFFLLNKDGTPIDNTLYSETKSLRGKAGQFLSRVVSGLEACDIPVWRYHSEAAPGQLEIAIGPFKGSMLNGADALVIARQAVYHIASDFDLVATFCPKPIAGLATGAHTHLSLEDENGKNLFEVSPGKANSFLSGIFQNLRNMMMVIAPTGNSYDRLQPSSWCGAFQCIGTENRQAAIRLIKNKQEIIERFEIKPADGTANPYLQLGAFIGAGLEGVKNKRSLPKEIECDPGSLPEDQKPECLPSSLGEAIEIFEREKFSEELFGPELKQLLVGMRKQEHEWWNDTEIESIGSKIKLLIERY